MGVPATITNSSASISTTEISIMTGTSTLTAQTTQGVVHCVIDFENSVAGDEWDVTMYEARAVGQTQLPIWKAHIRGVSDPLVLPPTFLCNGWNITVKRTAGTDRTIYWSVRQDVGDRNVLTWLGSTPNALSSGRVDASVGAMAADAVTEIVTGVWAAISEGTETVADTIRLIAARLFGKGTVQDGDGAYTFRDKADTKNRIVMTRSGTARTVSTRDGT